MLSEGRERWPRGGNIESVAHQQNPTIWKARYEQIWPKSLSIFLSPRFSLSNSNSLDLNELEGKQVPGLGSARAHVRAPSLSLSNLSLPLLTMSACPLALKTWKLEREEGESQRDQARQRKIYLQSRRALPNLKKIC